MSSLTLQGATGALLGWARYAKPEEIHDIQFLPSRRFVISGSVAIDEIQLRTWFAQFFSCGPTQEDIDAGFQRPTREQLRDLGQLPPDVGFKLTGDVECDAGFVVSWDGGWIRGNAAGCLLPVRFTPNHQRAIGLRQEIESLLHNANRMPENVG